MTPTVPSGPDPPPNARVLTSLGLHEGKQIGLWSEFPETWAEWPSPKPSISLNGPNQASAPNQALPLCPSGHLPGGTVRGTPGWSQAVLRPAPSGSPSPSLLFPLHFPHLLSNRHLCPCCVPSRVQLFATPWTVAHQAPLSMGFSRQEYWSGWPFPPPEDLPDPEIEPILLHLLHRQAVSFPL